jgi:C1A family cysteine protease/subtilisin-like proprotein convertase family protein
MRATACAISCSIGLVLLLAFVPTDTAMGCDGKAAGTANPAAVYCQDLGYEYEIVDTAEGQYGTCAFPDDSKCDEWRFLEGKCGKSYSYCARQGYDLITKTDGKNPFSTEYSVCVDDGQEIDSATELMGLGEKAIRGSRPVQEAPSPPGEGVAAVGQPASFDWRNYDGQDWMTSVKNQASCGSCWAFSGVGTTEAVHNIAAGNPNLDLNLSEEYLVSDCYDWQAASCCGGFQSEALKFIRDNGIPDEACLAYVSGTCSCYPATCNTLLCTYTAGDSCGNAQCSDRCGDWAGRLETITSMGKVSPSQIKQHVVDRGPLAVAMGINLPDSYFDGSNIYRCTDDSTLNHAVIIAGYDDAGGYWIVKNSWGASWGPDGNGYFKVGYGECGIESEVFYASLVDQSCSSYTSTDVPKSIPNPGTVTSDLNVGDSFPLVDVNVGPLNITYPWDEDLDAFLISPLGTRVELFTDVGGDGANFINTVLDDESVYPIEVNDAPFSYTFRPEGVLADLNGEDSSGQWQLEVTDDYPVDVGTLDSWDLELCVGCDPGVDTDGDDFDNDVECYVGTDPLDDCPDVIGIHDAWPFDNNIDTNSNVLDILQYKGNIQFCLPDPGYVQRFDLNTDGCVDVLDILLYKGHLQVQCTNP